MSDFWKQVRLPLLVVGGTLFAVATIIFVVYSVYWMTKNPEVMGKVASGWASAMIASVVAFLYFIPTAVAAMRRHHNAVPIFIVNGFSGLAALLFPIFLAPGIGVSIWVASLAWAASATPVHRQAMPR